MMSSDGPSFLSRDELLGGLPARRASSLLYAIENRTAHLVARSRRAMDIYGTEGTTEEQEREFLEAFAQGREPPIQPTIQDLERYSAEWASLVPPDPSVRAAVARMIGEKYFVPRTAVPGLSQALGLTDEVVQQAFQRHYHQPLQSIFKAKIPWRERLRWIRARAARRLESLPPFWTAFALTLTETVGAGILALPIAVAEIGVIGGLGVLLILGIVNLLTIAAMAEAVARNGNVRYGRAYFGGLVSDYLGRPAAWVLNPALLMFEVVGLLVYYVGFGSTLSASPGLPAEVWVALLFLVGLFFLRKPLDATVASALAVGAACVGIVVVLSLLSLPHVESANLRFSQIPFVDGEPFEASIIELIFGIVLLAYFGHTSLGHCAAVVLRRDPSARSFFRGAVCALVTSIALYCIWVFAVNGVVAPATLAAAPGTALVPLAAEVGASVEIMGSIFVMLAMGMGSINISHGLSHLAHEWMPFKAHKAHRRRPRSSENYLFGDVHFWIGATPVIAIFVLVEALLFADRASFAGPLGFLGAIAAPILAGIFPVLMVAASRRKGDCAPSEVWRLVGHPVTVSVIYLIFLAALVLHGLVIWQEPLERAAALLAAAASVAITVAAFRRGAFNPRAVVELRTDAASPRSAVVNVVVIGRQEPAEVELTFGRANGAVPLVTRPGTKDGELSSARIELPALPIQELKVWAHRLSPEGISEAMPVALEIDNGTEIHEFDWHLETGQTVVSVSGEELQVRIDVINA